MKLINLNKTGLVVIGLILIGLVSVSYYLFKKTQKPSVSGIMQTINLDLYETYLNKPYQFDDFSTSFKKYKVANVKFEGDFTIQDNPNYWNDWGSIFTDIKNSELDFAGHYKLVSAGNGTMQDLYLVDGLTGKIYSPVEMMSTGPSTYLYKNNSKLIVLAMNNNYDFVPETEEETVYFYYTLQDDRSFKLLGNYIYKNNKFIKVK